MLFAGYALKWLADLNGTTNTSTVLAYTVYSSSAGERKTLELADGSSVILNSNSTLKIPSDFNVEKRNLQLTGEAFFDVAKNKEKPFINAVSANIVKSRFNISAENNWKEDKLIFRDASLPEIAQQLEYWYGLKVNLEIANAKKVRFNGEFFNTDINKVLAAITYVNKLTYSLNNKEITIISK